MGKGSYVKDIQTGQRVSGYFVVHSAQEKKARNGQNFYDLVLSDATGRISAKVWNSEESGLPLPREGSYIEVMQGTGETFNRMPQIRIERFRDVPEKVLATLRVDWFRPTSARSTEEMWAELDILCGKEFVWKPWRELFTGVFADEDLRKSFCSCPAAVSVHHAYVGGLLEHTLSVCRIGLMFADLYPMVDRQALLSGCVFHDIGKIREYGYASDIMRTDEGMLVGHPVLGVAMLEPHLRSSGLPEGVCQHLRHMILSHHGRLEYGACVLPQTLEAMFVHLADLADARAKTVSGAVQNIEENSWSEAIPSLDRRRFFRPVRTPDTSEERTGSPAGKDTQSFSGRLARSHRSERGNQRGQEAPKRADRAHEPGYGPEPVPPRRVQEDSGKPERHDRDAGSPLSQPGGGISGPDASLSQSGSLNAGPDMSLTVPIDLTDSEEETGFWPSDADLAGMGYETFLQDASFAGMPQEIPSEKRASAPEPSESVSSHGRPSDEKISHENVSGNDVTTQAGNGNRNSEDNSDETEPPFRRVTRPSGEGEMREGHASAASLSVTASSEASPAAAVPSSSTASQAASPADAVPYMSETVLQETSEDLKKDVQDDRETTQMAVQDALQDEAVTCVQASGDERAAGSQGTETELKADLQTDAHTGTHRGGRKARNYENLSLF